MPYHVCHDTPGHSRVQEPLPYVMLCMLVAMVVVELLLVVVVGGQLVVRYGT